MKRGRLVVVEGIEGTGKSSAIRALEGVLDRAGVRSHCTREPGGTPLAEQLRRMVLHTTEEEEPVEAITELMLVFAARAQHLTQVVLPHLGAGDWVLCDRFVDSSYAYQGAGRGLSKNLIAQLEQAVCGELVPDLVMLMDLSIEAGLKRARQDDVYDRIEHQDDAFHGRVRECYLERARQDPARFAVIDAGLPQKAVHAQMCQLLEQALTRFGRGE